MEQTAAGLGTTHGLDGKLEASIIERETLRSLASKLKEQSVKPSEQEKIKLWTAHNDLKPVRPLIFCDPENGWNEIITQEQLQCTNPLLRVWEMSLRKELFWACEMKDDRVAEACLNIPYNYTDTGFGIEEKTVRTSIDGSCIWIPKIQDYERDFALLKYPEIIIDYKRTDDILSFAKELFGDIIEIRLKGPWWWTLGMTWDFIKIRGLENLMLDILLNPEWVHKMMEFLSTAIHRKLDFLVSNGLLSLNTGGSYVGSGGFGWTKELPQPGFQPGRVRTQDMWGFSESQETIGIDPEAFGEFIFPYQLGILERFGLNCYGCCEPIDPRWQFVRKIPRLRRVSVSPWANVDKMAENLQDKYIFSYKSNPVDLASPSMDEKIVRNRIRSVLKKTRNCVVEIIMKDNHTLGKNPNNAVLWTKIAREEIEE